LFNIGAADLEADRFAENLFERREVAVRRPDFELGVS
jgi:hypothetical protein